LFITCSQAQAQTISELYEKLKNSVVVIETKERMLAGYGPRKEMVTSAGLGTGVLISSDGVITAAHVVQAAENIKVKFADGEEIPGKVVSSNVQADVALVRLIYTRKNPTIAKLADSYYTKVGDQVFVVGAPYGLEHSLSVGYISAKRQEETISTGFVRTEFFQTDAAINKGNSGGPMFNMNGEVVGIASHILSETGGFQGLGFAATSNVASRLLLERRGFWSGVDGFMLTAGLAKAFNVPQNAGILVQRVVLVSPAGAMGMRGGEYKANIEGRELMIGGDIILAVNGITIGTKESRKKFQELMDIWKSGDTFSVKILREGKTMELTGKIP